MTLRQNNSVVKEHRNHPNNPRQLYFNKKDKRVDLNKKHHFTALATFGPMLRLELSDPKSDKSTTTTLLKAASHPGQPDALSVD